MNGHAYKQIRYVRIHLLDSLLFTHTYIYFYKTSVTYICNIFIYGIETMQQIN